jgi:hypothetical protein
MQLNILCAVLHTFQNSTCEKTLVVNCPIKFSLLFFAKDSTMDGRYIEEITCEPTPRKNILRTVGTSIYYINAKLEARQLIMLHERNKWPAT